LIRTIQKQPAGEDVGPFKKIEMSVQDNAILQMGTGGLPGAGGPTEWLVQAQIRVTTNTGETITGDVCVNTLGSPAVSKLIFCLEKLVPSRTQGCVSVQL
jgi:hypothetical protein